MSDQLRREDALQFGRRQVARPGEACNAGGVNDTAQGRIGRCDLIERGAKGCGVGDIDGEREDGCAGLLEIVDERAGRLHRPVAAGECDTAGAAGDQPGSASAGRDNRSRR